MSFFARKHDWPVVDGVPTKPYAIPPDPVRDRQAMDAFEHAAEIRAERERTRPSRTRKALDEAMRARRGPGYTATLFGRYILAAHRAKSALGTKISVRLIRRNTWDIGFDLNVWRRRK